MTQVWVPVLVVLLAQLSCHGPACSPLRLATTPALAAAATPYATRGARDANSHWSRWPWPWPTDPSRLQAVNERGAFSYVQFGVCVLLGALIGFFFPLALERTRTSASPPGTGSAPGIVTADGCSDELPVPEMCTIDCLDNRIFELPITPETTCGDLVSELQRMLGLLEPRNQYSLFARPTNNNLLTGDMLLNDKVAAVSVLSTLRHSTMLQRRATMASTGTSSDTEAADQNEEPAGTDDEDESDKPTRLENERWQIMFKAFGLFEPDPSKLSRGECVFLLEQVHDTVMRRLYPATDADLLQLGALRAQYKFGDFSDNLGFPASCFIHPAQRDMLWSPTLAHDADTQAILRSLRKPHKNTRRRTRTKKRAFESNEMTTEELEGVKAAITVRWKALCKMPREKAARSYISLVSRWRGFGGSVFPAKVPFEKGLARHGWKSGQTRAVWLVVKPDEILLFEPHAFRREFVCFPLTAIESFGSSASVFRFNVEDVGIIEADCPQAGCIARLVTLYAQAFLKSKLL
eukprot:m.407692 g.407692  ORF g.407692 m.407692 type:complete len:521 (+) comp20140_c1_seq11:131-1693(+)